MRLSEICEINPKAQVMNDATSVSFVAMPDVSEDGKINVGAIRTYGEVRKGFTSFIEGDVLFAKITPCSGHWISEWGWLRKHRISCVATKSR